MVAIGRNGATVAVLCLVQAVDVLGVTVVVAALPGMLAGLNAPASAVTPLATGYAMFFGTLWRTSSRSFSITAIAYARVHWQKPI